MQAMVIAAVITLLAPPAETPERTRMDNWPTRYREYVQTWCDEQVPQVEAAIESAQETALKGDRTQGKKIKELKAQLALLKGKRNLPEPKLYSDAAYIAEGERVGPRKGEMGRLYVSKKLTYRVQQVLDGKRAIITPELHRTVSVTRGTGEFGKTSISTRSEVAALKPFILANVDTDGWADGDPVQLMNIYECVGSETYETVGGGSETSLVIEQMPAK